MKNALTGRIQCDAEIRKFKDVPKGERRWGGCRRTATVFGKGLFGKLDYCARHAKKAEK